MIKAVAIAACFSTALAAAPVRAFDLEPFLEKELLQGWWPEYVSGFTRDCLRSIDNSQTLLENFKEANWTIPMAMQLEKHVAVRADARAGLNFGDPELSSEKINQFREAAKATSDTAQAFIKLGDPNMYAQVTVHDERRWDCELYLEATEDSLHAVMLTMISKLINKDKEFPPVLIEIMETRSIPTSRGSISGQSSVVLKDKAGEHPDGLVEFRSTLTNMPLINGKLSNPLKGGALIKVSVEAPEHVF